MRRNGFRVLITLLPLCVALSLITSCASVQEATQSGPPSTGICARVSNGHAEAFILGSIHIGSASMYPLGSHILNALQGADTLVFECNTDGAEIQRQCAEMMRCRDNETLQMLISPQCYALAELAAKEAGYSLTTLNTFKPWAVANMLSLKVTARELGLTDADSVIALGVEKKITELTAKSQKPVRYLETAEDQLAVLDAFSPELQEYLLRSTCEEILGVSISASNNGIQQWPEWWRKGDAKAFADAYLSGMITETDSTLIREYHQTLVTMRNQQMAQEIAQMLEQEGEHRYFITIGLLHMVLPDDNVLDELKQMGYQIETEFSTTAK